MGWVNVGAYSSFDRVVGGWSGHGQVFVLRSRFFVVRSSLVVAVSGIQSTKHPMAPSDAAKGALHSFPFPFNEHRTRGMEAVSPSTPKDVASNSIHVSAGRNFAGSSGFGTYFPLLTRDAHSAASPPPNNAQGAASQHFGQDIPVTYNRHTRSSMPKEASPIAHGQTANQLSCPFE